MSGVDLNTIRELLGHSDFRTTQMYAHLSKDHRLRAVNLLNSKIETAFTPEIQTQAIQDAPIVSEPAICN